ncbi:hypothetical protein [Ovoidimarina sediminis]|uniref:hypothetical protein n=1 Tax=Ovoidimarina sediminis TaxID=3079856 RepID=UPI00290B9A1F|nr:hypothetical protein [Rhodophyticola sp. MJ-SS7]MDU8942376.1 hypothetical protein [Rhodophyticola sp. MJ-SS7]
MFKLQLMGIVAVAAFATAGDAAVYSVEFEATDLCYNCNNPDPDIYSPDQPVSGSFTIDYTFDANIYEESSGLTKTGDSLGYLSDAAFNYTLTDVLVIGGIADTLSSIGFTYGDFFLRIDDFLNNPTLGYFSYREQCALPANFCFWYASEVGTVTVTLLDDGSNGPPSEVPNVPIPATLPLLLGSGLMLIGLKRRIG